MTWIVKFQRYDPKTTSGVLSYPEHIQAKDFADAAEKAELMRRSFQNADPAREYRIIGVESHDYRGEQATGLPGIFNTQAEQDAYLAEQEKKRR